MVLERLFTLQQGDCHQISSYTEICLHMLSHPCCRRICERVISTSLQILWNGTDKATRPTTINDYPKGGLKMIDLDCMIKSLRLAWLQRIYNVTEGPWKWYLFYLLTKLMTSRFLHYSILNF